VTATALAVLPDLSSDSSPALALVYLDLERVRRFAEAAHSQNTARAYRRDLAAFTRWCAQRGVDPLPAEPLTVASYVSQLAADGRAAATIARHVTAISQAHEAAGLDSPTQHKAFKTVWKGIRRTIGVAQKKKWRRP
jgi:hypothetical protein